MKKRNGFFGLIICASLVLSGGSISKYISANAGYCIAAALTSSPAIQNGAAGAGGAAGGLAAVWAGAKIGGKAGAIIGGPVGIVCGAFLGAM
jgi:hypothetical protein